MPGQRTPDFLVDGVPTELKTMSDVREPTERRLAGGIARRAMDARGQAAHVIIDARGQEGMTQKVAEDGIGRALNADLRRGLQSVRVVGPNFDLTRSRP